MRLVDEQIERYALEHTTAPDPQLDALDRAARVALPYSSMLSGPVVGRLLETLVFALDARRVLEIGTYAGYSALAMAGAIAPGGELITCEIDAEHAQFARDAFAAS